MGLWAIRGYLSLCYDGEGVVAGGYNTPPHSITGEEDVRVPIVLSPPADLSIRSLRELSRTNTSYEDGLYKYGCWIARAPPRRCGFVW